MTAEPDTATVHLRIHGRVQGVGYRAWTSHTAKKRGLAGWVRNLSDGTVEAVVQGPRAAVNAMVAACQAGPPLARVLQVNSRDVAEAEVFAAFQQLPTADPS